MQHHDPSDKSVLPVSSGKMTTQTRITQRLVKYLASKSDFSMVALVTVFEGDMQVDVIASDSGVTPLGIPLSESTTLPVDVICRVLGSEKPETVAVCGQDAGVTGLVYPLIDDGMTAGALYVVSELSASELKLRINKLDAIHSLLTMTLLQVQQQSEQERLQEQQRSLEQALQFNESYLKAIMRHSPALLTVSDLKGAVLLCSAQLAKLSGAAAGMNIVDAYPKPLAEFITSVLRKEERETVETELSFQFRNGELRSYLVLAFPLLNEAGELIGICSIGTDISDRKRSESALRDQHTRLNHLAYYDSLTELPNRILFDTTLSASLLEAKRRKSRVALLLLDLDRFKNANDSLGHDVGDELLKGVALRLTQTVRDKDTVARLGGDEFVVLIEDVYDLEDVEHIAKNILFALNRPLHIDEQQYLLTASLGISVFPDTSYQARELLKHAEGAMYQAKASGKNRYQFYTDAMSVNGVDAFQLENDLRRAIELDQLYLLYQPQVDMETGALEGVEALIRWAHPKRGLINPVHFIPMAEETGLIIPLGEWVIREACHQQKQWLEEGFHVGKIAVNISAKQLSQPNFVDSVKQIFLETGLSPEYIEFEITENSAMETAADIIGMLGKMNAMGLSLAIDDFGTGYSSLAYLKRFPVQKLKIDRSFIDELVTDVNDAVISQSIIGLAHNMQLKVIAEGVENTDQQEWLIQKGCRLGQGFLFSQPISSIAVQEKYFNEDKTLVMRKKQA